jgi:hypothetical protein
MTALRVALIAVGIGVTGYGVALLLGELRVIMLRIVLWALVGVVMHDLVFAPLCVALGFAGRRLIPQKWWGPVAAAALCSVVLVMLAVPVFDKPGMRPDNLTVLDRDYHAGLWISLAIVWACVPLYLLAARFLPVRKKTE